MKPDFFKNEMLAELSAEARLLFAGLWCMADREGRLEDRPKRIEAEIFPYQKVSTDSLLNDLSGTKDPFIIRYEVDGKKCIQIVNFLKHQRPHPKESPSMIPKAVKRYGKAVKLHGSTRPLAVSPSPLASNPIASNPIGDIALTRQLAPGIPEERRDYRIPEPTEDPTAGLVMYYKAVKKGILYQDRTWDKTHWPRSAKAAIAILKVCGSYEAARACIDQVVADLGEKSWTLETVLRWAHEWKAKQGGKDYGATNSASFFNAVAQQRSKAKFENLRKVSGTGEILDGIRDMPKLLSQDGVEHGTAGKPDVQPLAGVRETTLEAKADRRQTS